MNHMNLTMKNISTIRHATFDITPITVICGQNFTGKSLVVDGIEMMINVSNQQEQQKITKVALLYRNGHKFRGNGSMDLYHNGHSARVSYVRCEPWIIPTFSASQGAFSAFQYKQYFPERIPKEGSTERVLPDWVTRQISGHPTESSSIIQNRMGLTLSINDDNIVLTGLYYNPIILKYTDLLLSKTLFSIVGACDFLNQQNPNIKSVVLIKNPEFGMSDHYLRQYVNMILDLSVMYRQRGVDVAVVIETVSPCVLTQIASRLKTDPNVSPEDIRVYGMSRNSYGNIQAELTGYYDEGGVLMNWKPGFLTK